jgi:hypothetical protein
MRRRNKEKVEVRKRSRQKDVRIGCKLHYNCDVMGAASLVFMTAADSVMSTCFALLSVMS